MNMEKKLNDKLLIPQELRDLNQWTYSFSTAELKRPTHTDYKHNGALCFADALLSAGFDRFIGFFPTFEDPIVLLDLDNIKNPNDPWDELPPKLSIMLKNAGTYSEISPSGKGLRFLLKLNDANEKSLLGGKNFYSCELENAKQAKKVQMNIGPPWMTITQDVTDYSVDNISVVSLDDLDRVFRLKYKVTKLNKAPLTSIEPTRSLTVPRLNEIKAKMLDIPLDQNDRVVRGYEEMTGQSYQHYQFWNHVLMALHHYATITDQVVECFNLADEWSQCDPEHYKNSNDIRKHWESFDTKKDTKITFRSIFGIYNACHLVWPKPMPQTDTERMHNRPRRPKQKYYSNFQAMLKFYDVKLYRDSADRNMFYITGDKDIVGPYFLSGKARLHFSKYYGPFDIRTLSYSMIQMLQEEGFGDVTHKQANDHISMWVSGQTKTIDLIRLYFEIPFSQLSEEYKGNARYLATSDFKALWNCITLDYLTEGEEQIFNEYCLYRSMFKKWLFGYIRAVYPAGMSFSNNSILVLTGKEQIRKTSFFRYLMPPQIRQLAFTTHGFTTETDKRDIVKLASNNRILVWDEIEQFLNYKSESSFKKILDGLPQTLIDKYEVSASVFVPIAIYGGTSNKRKFQLSRSGNRRLFHIPVKWVDTEAMSNLCWHPIMIELRNDYLESSKLFSTPELLTPNELSIQGGLIYEISEQTNLEYMLKEIYDFDVPFIYNEGKVTGVTSFRIDKTHRFISLSQVHADIQLKFSGRYVDFVELANTMGAMCADWTNTIIKKKEFVKPKCYVKNGIACQNQYKKYLVPPKREIINPEVLNNFD